MTRINLVDPAVLTDKHLMAEYRELPRIFTAVAKNPQKAATCTKPEHYTLGTGHVIFFYDKLGYLYCRYCKLYNELEGRSFNIDRALFLKIRNEAMKLIVAFDDTLVKHYCPTPEEIYLNMARLAKRSKIDRVLIEVLSRD